ncbi:oligoendopeptidase F [Tenuibacillus multivorans]|uniref:Oligopeptidase F n=1 Tax=Tenuibacillus multivorans TaxID=237069 RepID=A0A1H0E0E0_9BACI|nr:oligoendopeptidase F [Tenuibacillus multivorans]GEL76700.1 oligoendopeptidase F [Tenuibacillus multivorans]SDN75977.1 oligoendopeptidase F [Tenuibacillus multivorans]
MVKTRLNRSEVPEEQTWKVEDLFKDNEEWEKALKEVEELVPSVTKYKGRLNEGADVFFECLEARTNIQEKIVHVATYANLRASEDGTNPENQANSGKLASTLAQVGASLSFMESEILALPEGTIEQYLKENDDLKVYENYLNDLLEEKPYTLSPETEEVLASLSEVHGSPYTIYLRSKSSDMEFDNFVTEDGEEHSNSFALFEDEYELSPDTDTRRKAYDSFVKTLSQYQNTYAATYATEVKKQVQLSRVRGYDNVTQMLLQPQKVTEEMYHNQLDVIQKELAPHMRRFAKLKKKVLGLDKMTFADLKAPLDPEFNPKTTYEEVSQTILEALSVMGPEYTDIIKKGLSERWVDYADNIGKSTGAFCASPYGSHPFILLTWTGAMRGGFILAHELGHAGHFYLANQNQRIFNTRPSTYFIEAPSTMNEMLLADHLLSNNDDPRMRRWIILQLLGTYYHNFVTHLLEGEFQRRVYDLAEKGVPLTASTLKEQKGEALANFWGDAVELDEGAKLTWMRQPHYYMGLYPYTYSAGLTASTLVSQMIKEEGQPAIDRWLDVLKSGGTKSPLELLKQAGVDMSTPEPIQKAVGYVGSLVDELEKSYEESVTQ